MNKNSFWDQQINCIVIMATKVQGLDQRSEKISDLEVQVNLLNEKAHQRSEKIFDVEVQMKLLTEKAERDGENAKQLENQGNITTLSSVYLE